MPSHLFRRPVPERTYRRPRVTLFHVIRRTIMKLVDTAGRVFIFGAEVNGAWRRSVAAQLRAERAARAERQEARAAAQNSTSGRTSG